MANDRHQTSAGVHPDPQTTIHDLFERVREHPDFVFGTVFVLGDFAEETVPSEFSVKQAEEALAQTGNRLIADAGGWPQDG